MNNKEWHSYRKIQAREGIQYCCCALSSVGHEEGVLEFRDRLCHSSSDTWLFWGTLLHKSALLLCESDRSWLQVFFIIGGSEHTPQEQWHALVSISVIS